MIKVPFLDLAPMHDELKDALDAASRASGPYLVDCAVGVDELVLPMLAPAGGLDDIIVRVGE